MTGTLLTTVEVAERLGMSSAAVAQAVRSGALQPAARTSEDYLFTERAIDAYTRHRAELAAEPPKAPPEGSRQEWVGELDRLSLWLGELNDAARPPEQTPGIQIDFQPPPPPAALAPPAPAPPPPPTSTPALPPVDWGPAPEPKPAPPAEPEPESVPSAAPKAQVTPPSRQALLVVQPIDRFRLLKEVAELLGAVPGLAEARLESLENGLASYRLSFEVERPTGEMIADTLATLGLGVMMVDSGP